VGYPTSSLVRMPRRKTSSILGGGVGSTRLSSSDLSAVQKAFFNSDRVLFRRKTFLGQPCRPMTLRLSFGDGFDQSQEAFPTQRPALVPFQSTHSSKGVRERDPPNGRSPSSRPPFLQGKVEQMWNPESCRLDTFGLSLRRALTRRFLFQRSREGHPQSRMHKVHTCRRSTLLSRCADNLCGRNQCLRDIEVSREPF